MKGTLHKTEDGWQVSHATYDLVLQRWTAGRFPIHPHDLDSEIIRWANNGSLDGKEVEFEWCVILQPDGKGKEYARLTKPKRIIDLQNLETKLHQALSEETDESLTEWLESKRQGDVEKLAEKEYPIFDGDLLGIAHNQKHSRIDFIKGYNKAKETLYTEEQVCINCDEQKMTHEICMDCIGKMIKENQVNLYTEEQAIEFAKWLAANWFPMWVKDKFVWEHDWDKTCEEQKYQGYYNEKELFDLFLSLKKPNEE
jgi:ribosomal protein L32